MFNVLASDNPEREAMDEALDGAANIDRVNVGGEEAALAEAARRDPRAFGELYERYYARVYRYIYHRLGNTAEAEDVTALVFMKALEALPHYRAGKHGFAPWIFRIARNAVVDHYRKARWQHPLDEADCGPSNDDPERETLGRERREELHALMSNLSTEQRDAVLMRYSADLSFAEIATAMKKNEPAVRMLLHRGLRKLKAVMDNERE